MISLMSAASDAAASVKLLSMGSSQSQGDREGGKEGGNSIFLFLL